MSIKTTLAALKTYLANADPTLIDPTTDQIPLARIYENPAEAVNLADFPLAILALAPQIPNSTSEAAVSYAKEVYMVRIYLLVGDRNTGLEEVHARVLPWPRAIATALMADLKLGGAVQFIGDTTTGELFKWTVGPKAWGDGIYFGITFDLPVCEWFETTMGI